jgi:hypothetical protein
MVVAITNKFSTTFEVVHNKMGHCFEFNEVDKLTAFFNQSLAKFDRQEFSYFTKQGFQDAYSAKNNAKKLAQLLLSLRS